MRFSAQTIFVCFILLNAQQIWAQARHELSFSVGGGTLQVDPEGGATPVYSFSYRCHISSHLSAEGALDIFYYKFVSSPSGDQANYRDDYLGAEAALVYHFLPNRETRRFLPFVAAGIGKTTSDFTEIPAHPYYRFGAGFSYNLTDKWGLRFEARDEIIKSLYANGSPSGNLPSARLGIVRRF